MACKKATALLKKSWMFYLFGFALVLGIKYFYSKASVNELTWILSPTAWWVRRLSGISFEFEPNVGYINYDYRFIIASSCSGIQFMIICISALIFSFVHRMNTFKKGLAWMAFSLATSYLFTIPVNGLRIVVSVFLPLYARRLEFYTGLLTPERLHTLIGIAIYFISLFTLYQTAEWISWSVSRPWKKNWNRATYRRQHPSWSELFWKCSMPMFWYFAIVLGLPFLNRAYEHESRKFTEYAVLISAVCLTVAALYCLGAVVKKRFGKRSF